MRDRILENAPRVRRVMLLALTAGVPLFFLRVTQDPFGVPKLGLLMIGVSLVAGVRAIEILQGAGWRGLTRLAVPALAFASPLLVSWILAPHKYWSLFGWYPRFLGLVPYLVVVVYGVLMADAFAGRARDIAWTFALTGGVVGLYGIMQVLGVDPFGWNTSAGGSSFAISTLGNSNFAGTYLGMCLPFLLPLWVSEHERRRHLVVIGAAITGGIVVSLSEAAWAAALAGAAVIAGFAVARRLSFARLAALIVPVGATLALAGFVLYRIANPAADSITYRGYWWRAAAEMAMSSPIVGRGPAAFALEGIRYRPAADAVTFGYGFPDDPHVVALSLLTAAGAIGLLGFLFLLYWALSRGYPAARDRLLPAAFLASVLVYFVNSVTTIDEIALRVAFWGVIGGLAASLVVEQRKRTQTKKAASRRARVRTKGRTMAPRRATARRLAAVPAVLAIGLASLVASWWSIGFVVADAHARQGESLFLVDEVEEARAAFRGAIGFRGDYGYRQLYGIYLGIQAAEDPPAGQELIDEMNEVFAFTDDVPYVPAMADYAKHLYEWGSQQTSAYDRALAVYERIRRLDPLNATVAVDTADVLVAVERHDDAVDLLTSYIADSPERADLHGALSVAYFHLGQVEQATQEMETALALNSGDEHALKTRSLIEKSS